ncbi:MAG TPA: sulfite exporter TauE/SafE family protein [Candidatus Limnocylindrales bacterium]|nr:sulfite exporter TauE/SafE family protein [Candidatus Limnocylindrales bacterium]
MPDPWLLAALFFVAALLYASVGHAGASAYLAAMALLGVSPEIARPTALTLNILVASFVTLRFWRAGLVHPRTLLPFVVASIPLAFVGGAIHVPANVYKPLLGAVLLVAAAGFARTARRVADDDAPPPQPPIVPALLVGGVIGLLSGLTGTGGGIFLSPLLLVAGWATTRQASGIASGFILLNSIAGLAGNVSAVGGVPSDLPLWGVAVLVGAVIGAEIGSRRASPLQLRLALAVVLALAGLKLILLG